MYVTKVHWREAGHLRMERWREFRLMFLVYFALYWVLLDLCEDKVQCQVLAESTTFRQDPCPATSKYLEVHYKCRPDEFERMTVCEGQQMEVSCKRSMRIAIYSAMFGRAPNGSSPCPPNRPGYIDCQSSDTVSEVRTACQGRKRCDLQASEDVFGNPCAAGINKYLTVTYACVPKKILKELRRHRGRLSVNRRKKKKKKKKKKDDRHQEGEVTKLTSRDGSQDSDTTSPNGELSAAGSTRVLETYLQTETVETSLEGEQTDQATKDQDPSIPHLVTIQPHLEISPPTFQPPVITTGTAGGGLDSKDRNPAVSSSDPTKPNPNQDQRGPNRARDQNTPHRDQDQLETSRSRDQFGSDRDYDLTSPGRSRDDQTGSSVNKDNSIPNRHLPENWQDGAGPKLEPKDPRGNSVSATGAGTSDGGGGGRDMSTEATDSGKNSVNSVTEANLTALCVNHTVGAPTVRTLPSNSEAPIGVVKELFSTVRFVQGHQEKAILYIVLGVCVGVILLLVAVLGRVCYKMKRNSHAKLDMTEPTHSRNVSHLAHHMNHQSLLETPMLEHSDSIDRIEVVRFEPRGTMRSGYHSTLRSDSGDRSLNNYYG